MILFYEIWTVWNINNFSSSMRILLSMYVFHQWYSTTGQQAERCWRIITWLNVKRKFNACPFHGNVQFLSRAQFVCAYRTATSSYNLTQLPSQKVRPSTTIIKVMRLPPVFRRNSHAGDIIHQWIRFSYARIINRTWPVCVFAPRKNKCSFEIYPLPLHRMVDSVIALNHWSR